MKLFSKFFPLPHYLRVPVVGLDISDRSIKYAELDSRGGLLALKKFGKKTIEKGIIEKGVILDKVKLVEQLKNVARDLDNKNTAIALPEEKAFLKLIHLPFIEDSQVRGSVEVQIEEIVPLPSSEVVFDFEIIGRFPEKNRLDVVLSVFPSKIAEDYAEVLDEADLSPFAFEVESQSVFRSLVSALDGKATMVIDFGKTRTSFFVGENGCVKFCSTVAVAGESMDSALSKAMNINVFEAEKEKKNIVFRANGESAALSAVLPAISVLKDEAKRVLSYWQTHASDQGFENIDIEKILLCGGDANMPGLTDYFSHELKRTVENGNPWINITSLKEYVPEMERRESLLYATALGLSLRSFYHD
ncbi:MAG: type IV pilus assembly protein PilM [Candidatus Pacebacteria bacterium]|nr:type IV pilus assembly protein PilM [Candidatus Paceibacterota bacterium]